MNSEKALAEQAEEAVDIPAMRNPSRPARASFRFSVRDLRVQADAEITPLGLLAIGGMVGTILLAVAPIVAAVGRRRLR